MGDFFDNVVIFFEEYYLYVIGVGLIIILMLIGFLASRRKAKKDNHNGTMANINEVTTGSINDVASTIQGNNAEPVSVASSSEIVGTSSNQVANNDETEVLETEPFTNQADSFNNTQSVESVNNDTTSPLIEETRDNEADNFNKTEVIDFSALSKPEPVIEASPVNPSMDLPEFHNPSNTIEPVTIGSVNPVGDNTVIKPITDINFTEPTPIQSVDTMPANEAVTEEVAPVEDLTNEPVVDINPNNYNPFVVDNSQYDDILNGETSSTTNDSKM